MTQRERDEQCLGAQHPGDGVCGGCQRRFAGGAGLDAHLRRASRRLARRLEIERLARPCPPPAPTIQLGRVPISASSEELIADIELAIAADLRAARARTGGTRG